MKFSIVQYKAVACWQWNTSDEPHKLYRYGKQGAANQTGLPYDEADDDDDDDDDVCGICQLAFEACCPECAIPGDDCPLSECLPGLQRRVEVVTDQCSLGEMLAHVPYALLAEMDRTGVLEKPMSARSAPVG